MRPAFVDTFPAAMDQGVLYISIPYRTCGHLCCCGCGEEVVTPLSPAQWSFTYDGESVSLAPSIGNWALPCQSHYWISNGEIRWSRRYSAPEITHNREHDSRLLAEATPKRASKPLAGLRRLVNRWRR
jgi:hypothetical protein